MPTTPLLTRKRVRRSAAKTRRVRGGATAAARQPPSFTELLNFFEGVSGWGIKTGPALENYKTTYGEVTADGIRSLEEHFTRATPLSKLPTGQRAFYDLGCGVGKVVVGMVLLRPNEIERAVGVEIVPERIEGANRALGRIRNKTVASKCRFQLGSFLGPDVNLADAAWIYISNLCFDQDTQAALVEKMQKECRKGCAIACSKPLPLLAQDTRIHHLESGAHVPMSWSKDSTVHIYRVD